LLLFADPSTASRTRLPARVPAPPPTCLHFAGDLACCRGSLRRTPPGLPAASLVLPLQVAVGMSTLAPGLPGRLSAGGTWPRIETGALGASSPGGLKDSSRSNRPG